MTWGPDLHVLENPPFEVLLGRPWLTTNEVNIEERPDGTYIRLIKNNKIYLINVSPNPYYKKTLGAKGNLPSGYIVSFLWVLKQFAWLIPSR